MENIIAHLVNLGVLRGEISTTPISVGSGGAQLCRVDTPNGSFVVKHARRDFCREEALFEGCRKELAFYRLADPLDLDFLPKLIYSEDNNNSEILLVLEYIPPVAHSDWNGALLARAAELCARIGSLPAETLAPIGMKWNDMTIDQGFTDASYADWVSVLNEHPGRFDRALLDEIYHNIGKVPKILNSAPHCVVHGDFHPENILYDGEKLYVCDWQGVGVGSPGGDVSFFISRARGFGIEVNEDTFLDSYCTALSNCLGTTDNKSDIERIKKVSALMTTFSFWAHYLHGADEGSVAVHFRELEEGWDAVADR